MTRSLLMGVVLIHTAPVMLMGISGAMFVVLADGNAANSTLSNLLPSGTVEGFRPPDPDSGYQERLAVMAALLTCPMGLVAAKITKSTALHTMPVAIVSMVNTAPIVAIPVVMEALPL